MNPKLLGILFPTIFFIQVFATFSPLNLYPISPYRMFSRNWQNGIQMARISIQKDNNWYTVPSLLQIPFFQANNIAFSTFIDNSTESQKIEFCNQLNKHIKAPFSVYNQVIEFIRDDEELMKTNITNSEKIYECK